MFNYRYFAFIFLLGALILTSSYVLASGFKGIVVCSTGKPIVGAKVLGFENFSSDEKSATTSTVTAADGSFEYILPNDFTDSDCMITASGYADAAVNIVTDKIITITLHSPVSITGLVQDDQGKPVVGVRVAVNYVQVDNALQQPFYAPTYGVDVSGVTDSTGHYTISNLPENSMVSLVFADQPHSGYELDVNLPDDPKPMIYSKPGSIIGKVLTGDGNPAAKTYVNYDSAAGSDTILTDDNGHYKINGLAPGSCSITANIVSYSTIDRRQPLADWGPSLPIDVNVVKGQQTKAPDIILPKGALFNGTVTDSDTGAPIKDLQVELLYKDSKFDFYHSVSATTDEQGRYSCRIYPVDITPNIHRAPDDYLSPNDAYPKPIKTTEGRVYTADFRLKKGYAVKLHFVDQNGKTPPSLTYSIAETSDQQINAYPTSNPDSEGFYEIHSIAPGEYEIELPSLWKIVSGETFTVPASAPIEVKISQQQPLSLTGRVIDSDGNPISGVRLNFMINTQINQLNFQSHGDSETTDNFGKFTVSDLNPDDTATVTITKDKYKLISGGAITINKGGATITTPILTTTDHNLIGVVKDADGNPVSGAWVISTLSGPDLPVKSDATGHFKMTDLPGTSIELVAAGKGLFGRSTIEVKGATTYARITLTDKNSLPTPSERQRFFDIIEQLVPTTANNQDNIWWNNLTQDIAPFDPESGLAEVIKQGHVDDWTYFLTCMASCDIDPQLGAKTTKKLIAKIVALDFRAEAALRAGLAILPTDPDQAKYFYNIAKPLIPDKPQFSSPSSDESMLAALAYGLHFPEADDLTKAALDSANEDSNTPAYSQWEMPDIIGYIAITNPRVAKKLYDGFSSPTKDENLGSIISPTLACNPDSAVSTYKLFTGNQSPTYKQTDNIRLVGLDSKQNQAEALAFARSFPKGDGLATALLQVADNSPLASAKRIYEEAFDNAFISNTANSYATQSGVANHAWLRDKTLGMQLFDKAKQNIILLPSGGNSAPTYGVNLPPYADFAWYYAKIDPAYSRVLIEKEYAKDTQGLAAAPKVLSAVALAMSALNIDRAVSMANDIPDRHERNDTLHRIGMYAASPTDVRASIDFVPWVNGRIYALGLQPNQAPW